VSVEWPEATKIVRQRMHMGGGNGGMTGADRLAVCGVR
jgi:hypothetical protein